MPDAVSAATSTPVYGSVPATGDAWGASSTTSTQATRTPKQEYDSELFLELLVTQLRNQDPASSMDTGEIVSQTTSLAMMEALTSMSQLVEETNLRQQESFALQMRSAAADLLGQRVSYLDADGVEHTGTATAVSYRAGVPTVTVDGTTVDLDQVSAVAHLGGTADSTTDGTDAADSPAATDGATDSSGSGDAA
ncbi:flagellar hook capping FlgD N-terminal domain-containing protein [Isoptericola rhizosphaerae]|uniref:flagellar hook capping FlgD N-terminal domain-containing protein n=1 Tax=Isoptericola rhizosphaerae TaxID=3377837 RepID=UPI00383A8609